MERSMKFMVLEWLMKELDQYFDRRQRLCNLKDQAIPATQISGAYGVFSSKCSLDGDPRSKEEVISIIYKLGSLDHVPPIPDDALETAEPVALTFMHDCFVVEPQERPSVEVSNW
ncbi:hypothetical protein K469DRAFT_697991 [Zopfia rhizophila CBS 207.26]|uniref:Uncharacterized protein n=1 Tax=Zopfia rhizophila CBS 207.26 TaxID=1314779 RepID=A0A6A6EI72_9PEZI|nr:hypothetical protein K469DRAFT_697991 [Zopfia rhizophila CBS 207.26]